MADTANIAPDIKERTLALGPEGSFIVQSPAGSGKTGLLIQRFLALLPLVERPEEILAITFTRKAAGEMRIRIIDSLIKAKEGHFPENEYERVTLQLALKALIRDSEKGWRLLENPGRLKVQTIDSLSASVTRQMPLLSRLGRQPAISDNPGELYREASRRTVEMLGEAGLDGNAVRQALRRLDNSTSGLEERLSAMLEKRDQWLRHIKRGSEESGLREVLEGGVRNLIEDALTMAALAFPGHLTEDLLGCAGFAASNLAGTDPENAIAALKGLNSMPEASCKDLLLWKGVSELLLTKDGSFRKPKGVTVNIGFPSGKDKESSNRKKEFQDLLESLVPLDALQEGLSRVRRLPLPRYEEEDWATLDAIIRLLPIAEGHLKDVFAERGALDYQAIALSALDALGSEYEPTDIMLAMDIRIKHILVDEYQDTSRTQHELIRALTRGWEEGDGRTLFIVGDPMQSIYLFREAEVGLFLKAKESGIGGIRLTPLVLGCNFRSQGNIVDWVNSAFPNAFPTREDAFMGAVRYARSSAIKEALEKAGTELNIFKANGRERKDLDRAEAQAILEVIRGADRDETIAILAKSRSHLGAVVAALKDAGVDFKSEELDPLGERPVIEDLFSLQRALTHPCDRVAWLSILRAPWCGLTLRDIHELSAWDAESPVWELMNEPGRAGSLSDDGKRRLGAFKEKMSRAQSLRGRALPRALLEGLWISLGGPACYPDADAMKDAGEFFRLIEGASSGDGLVSIKGLGTRVEKLFSGRSGGEKTRVEIMTIHKAKGLEFDRVIVPGAGKKPPNAEKRLLLWMEKGADLLLSPIEEQGPTGDRGALYRYLSKTYSEKELLETARLLYVAATRAKKNLHIFGHAKEDSGTIKIEERSLLYPIRHILRPETLIELPAASPRGVPRGGPSNAREGNGETIGPLLGRKRLPLSWKVEEPLQPVLSDKEKALPAGAIEGPVFDWAGRAVRHLGTVVHGYLSLIAKDGAEKWSPARIDKEKGAISLMLRSLGLNKDEAQRTAPEATRIISNALNDARGRWVLKGRHGASEELKLTGLINGDIVRAAIDRTFVDEDGARWIIDFKTGAHRGGSLEAFLKNEKERYRAQLEAYEALIRAKGETRDIKKALYYPAIPAWIEM